MISSCFKLFLSHYSFNPQPNISDYNKFYPMSRFASFPAFDRPLFVFSTTSMITQPPDSKNTCPDLRHS